MMHFMLKQYHCALDSPPSSPVMQFNDLTIYVATRLVTGKMRSHHTAWFIGLDMHAVKPFRISRHTHLLLQWCVSAGPLRAFYMRGGSCEIRWSQCTVVSQALTPPATPLTHTRSLTPLWQRRVLRLRELATLLCPRRCSVGVCDGLWW